MRAKEWEDLALNNPFKLAAYDQHSWMNVFQHTEELKY